ncbi:hypothetical protein MED121_23479 [Marinomonas sp. MED121]|uniref:DUF484 family protein n=1 Tax=Marinomonas sp. MED121 TaxID=314277 RepID=UPI00006904F6|nr:DUF484 family protein [Marinomonas sp. MED121]EAQ64763.1 hypothetical protein MED121_23479 [Marinomonas sp. MED121]
MTEANVIEFLKANPKFFHEHLDLLEMMDVPHALEANNTVSLIERQVFLLRKSAEDYKSQFERLVHVARENEAIMHKSRRLVLASMGCASLDEFAIMLDDAMRDDFNIKLHSLVLFSDLPLDTNIRVTAMADAEPVLKEVLLKTGCYCGALSVAEAKYLFEDKADQVMSSAVLPLVSHYQGADKYIGMLALGSDELEKFKQEKGVLFLEYLSDILSAILIRLLP